MLLRPSLRLNYTFARYGDYDESEAQGFALEVDSRTAHNLTARLQLAGVWTVPKSSSELVWKGVLPVAATSMAAWPIT